MSLTSRCTQRERVSHRDWSGGFLKEIGPRRKLTRWADEALNMSESLVTERMFHQWYARPVFFVSDVQVALRFYLDKLGFEKKWHAGDGKGTVCQVDRGGCEIILCEDHARQDKARLFVELNREGMDELRREIIERALPTQKTWWGYDVIQVFDPDGNELLFPLDETNDREKTA